MLVAVLVVLSAGGWAGAHYYWLKPALVEVVAMPAVLPPPVAVPLPAPQPAAPAPAIVAAVPAAIGPGVAAIGNPSAETPTAAAGGPRFDIVRVGPEGNAVIAGRATPGSEVIVRDGGAEVARTLTDRQGSFVAIPAVPLGTGGRELTLASRSGGAAEVAGDGSVLLTVPAAPVPAAPALAAPAQAAPEPSGPVAVLVPSAAPPRILQGAAAPPEAGKPLLTLDTVDYDDTGAIRFTGGAGAGVSVRVYVDNGPAGDVRADAAGRWTLTPPGGVVAGVHTLRLDQIDSAGRVATRVELPFQRVAVSTAELSGGRVVVQPGQSLWRLARLAYGRGVQYQVIYLANRDQIRDPRLIYPGQTFAVPAP